MHYKSWMWTGTAAWPNIHAMLEAHLCSGQPPRGCGCELHGRGLVSRLTWSFGIDSELGESRTAITVPRMVALAPSPSSPSVCRALSTNDTWNPCPARRSRAWLHAFTVTEATDDCF